MESRLLTAGPRVQTIFARRAIIDLLVRLLMLWGAGSQPRPLPFRATASMPQGEPLRVAASREESQQNSAAVVSRPCRSARFGALDASGALGASGLVAAATSAGFA